MVQVGIFHRYVFALNEVPILIIHEMLQRGVHLRSNDVHLRVANVHLLRIATQLLPSQPILLPRLGVHLQPF